jgi:hypothetical protein
MEGGKGGWIRDRSLGGGGGGWRGWRVGVVGWGGGEEEGGAGVGIEAEGVSEVEGSGEGDLVEAEAIVGEARDGDMEYSMLCEL